MGYQCILSHQSFTMVFLVFFIAFVLGNVHSYVDYPKTFYRVVKQQRGPAIVEEAFDGNFSQSPANGYYQPYINETGWSFLQIETSASFSDNEQAYYAGYLEGYLTQEHIYKHWFNTFSDFCDGRKELCTKLDKFVEDNLEWVSSKASKLSSSDEYWHQVSLFYKQIQGVTDGYRAANKDDGQSLSIRDILSLNLNGDFDDLVEVIKAKENKFSPPKDYLPRIALGLGRCSALIKILPDGSELFVSQVTWNTYQSMLRVQKRYVFNLHKTPQSLEIVPGSTMTFSSYPGTITSGDDFYLISSGLASLETTIGNGNSSLWQFVKPNGQVFETVRSMVANRLAQNARSWAKIFSRYNSGTYNNQWMIVDYNKFKSVKGQSPSNLPTDTLWVVEQIPNYIYADDKTDVLRTSGYWPSYNVASFPWIFNMSGNQEMVKKFGDWFTYENTPRALIFKRDHGKVHDLKSMYQLMRYNDFKNDPLSACDCSPPYSAENAISARCDLNPSNGTYPFPALGHRQHGATDAKVTSSGLFARGLNFMAVSGPTFDESRGIPPFQWSQSDFQSTPHIGHPDKWAFAPFIKQWN